MRGLTPERRIWREAWSSRVRLRRPAHIAAVELVAKFGDSGVAAPTQLVEKWERVRVATGVELQFRTELARLKPAELRQVMALVEKALRKIEIDKNRD